MPATSEEHEPLLAENHANGTAKPTFRANYRSTTGEDCALQLEAVAEKGGGGSGEGSPSAGYPRENITYSWAGINVFSRAEDRRTRRLLNRLLCREPLKTSRKHILKNVTGIAYPGELMALMGSSGAGKTTLLNTLTFSLNHIPIDCMVATLLFDVKHDYGSPASVVVSGWRSLNGIPVDTKTLSSLSAYVQQDDLFIGTLTVREHLIFQALVRMDRHIPYETRMARVEEVISELTLSRCQNTIIGVPGKLKGISGGEMKRLSFASEVLTNPPLMFCDEPTSGLDSFMAQNVVTVLKSLAEKGKTVICTIHQPSSEVYAMFDKVLLMAEGKLAFLGTPSEANEFFKIMGAACPSNYNPADFFIQLLAVVPTREETCRNMIEMVCDSYKNSEIGEKMIVEAELNTQTYKSGWGGWGDPWSAPKSLSPYKASWWSQFKAVLWRSCLSVMKEPVLIKVRMLQTFMVALMIGVIYFGQELDQDGVMNINGALFICLTNMTFQNVFAVINVFCSELPVFLREHMNGMYRTDVYFLCKTMAEVPVFLAVPLLFTSVIYYMIGLNPAFTRFLSAAAIITLVSNVATSFGYFISCVSSSISVALSIGPPIIIPFLLFGGFFLNSGSVPPYFKWLSHLSWFKYGNEALLINQWEGVESISCTRSNTTCPKDGHVILETYNFSEDHYGLDYLALFGLIVGFRILAFLALLNKTYGRR